MLTRTLSRFADWAVKNHPKRSDDENSSTPQHFAAYVIPDYITGDPYITRVLFPRVFGFRPMLHHIHRPDKDRHEHSHPWSWAFSLILTGSYNEERNGISSLVRGWNFLRDTDFHKITKLHGEVWTLFIAGPRTQDWGFVVDGSVVPSDKYIAARKRKHATREYGKARASLEHD